MGRLNHVKCGKRRSVTVALIPGRSLCMPFARKPATLTERRYNFAGKPATLTSAATISRENQRRSQAPLQFQNSANHLVWVEWPSKFDSLNGRDGRPRPSHLSAGWRCEWRELDSLKSKRLVIRFLRVLSGRKASHGAARPPRPTISGNPACSTLRCFRGQTLSCEFHGARRSMCQLVVVRR
jgi:hypothetical protein